MLKTIISSEISIVIQGRFIPDGESSADVAETNSVADAWRHFLPDAQIIISTWEQPKHVSNSVDTVVINQDPGVTVPKCSINSTDNNVGRQILSTNTGLKVANRQYAIKTRTDIPPIGTGFIPLYLENRQRHPKYRLFDKPLVTCTFCTLDPDITGVSLHVCDIFHFGKTTDLMKLWSAPVPLTLKPQSQLIDYGFDRFGAIVKAADALLRPEQYIFLKLLQLTRPDIQLHHTHDDNRYTHREGEFYLFNNFTVRDAHDIGIQLPSRFTRSSMTRKIYSTQKILANELKYGAKNLPQEHDAFNFKKSTRLIYRYWRSAPQNMRVPCWLAAILMVIQSPSIIYSPKKCREWFQYRARGRALRKKLTGAAISIK